jgi:hypothetical protein
MNLRNYLKFAAELSMTQYTTALNKACLYRGLQLFELWFNTKLSNSVESDFKRIAHG